MKEVEMSEMVHSGIVRQEELNVMRMTRSTFTLCVEKITISKKNKVLQLADKLVKIGSGKKSDTLLLRDVEDAIIGLRIGSNVVLAFG